MYVVVFAIYKTKHFRANVYSPPRPFIPFSPSALISLLPFFIFLASLGLFMDFLPFA